MTYGLTAATGTPAVPEGGGKKTRQDAVSQEVCGCKKLCKHLKEANEGRGEECARHEWKEERYKSEDTPIRCCSGHKIAERDGVCTFAAIQQERYISQWRKEKKEGSNRREQGRHTSANVLFSASDAATSLSKRIEQLMTPVTRLRHSKAVEVVKTIKGISSHSMSFHNICTREWLDTHRQSNVSAKTVR